MLAMLEIFDVAIHISTETSKPIPLHFGQNEKKGSKVFGSFQLGLLRESYLKAHENAQWGRESGGPFPIIQAL